MLTVVNYVACDIIYKSVAFVTWGNRDRIVTRRDIHLGGGYEELPERVMV